MYGVVLFRTNISSIFDALQRSDIGLYEAGSVGSLWVLRIGMIFTNFQMFGILLYFCEWLKMLV